MFHACVRRLAFAGPRGLVSPWPPDPAAVPPVVSGRPHESVDVHGSGGRLRVVPADGAVLEVAASRLPPRTRRYLGRNSRLGLAAVARLLDDGSLSTGERERTALYAATFRGAWDPPGTQAMLESAGVDRAGTRPRAAAALEEYRARRTAVQYLLAMETAVPGQVSAALGLRGPVHALTCPGAAGGAQALARAALAIRRSDAPAAVALAVLTAEDAPAVAEYLDGTRDARPAIVECAAAALLVPADRGPGPLLAVAGERFEPATNRDGTVVDPWPGPVGPFLELAGGLAARPGGGELEIRGALGHRVRFRWGSGS